MSVSFAASAAAMIASSCAVSAVMPVRSVSASAAWAAAEPLDSRLLHQKGRRDAALLGWIAQRR